MNMAKFASVLLVIVYLIEDSTSLTIDSQLVTKNCFIRVALGEKLPSGDSTRRVDTPSVSKCERECTEDKERCNSFSFGISVKGNGTCELSIREIPESETKISDTLADPDFDIYAKRSNCNDKDGDIQDPLVTERPRPDLSFEDDQGYSGNSGRPGASNDGYGGSSSYGGSNRPNSGSGGSNSNDNYGSGSSSGSEGYGGSNRPSNGANDGYGGNKRPSDGANDSYGGNKKPLGESYGGYDSGSNRPSASRPGGSGSNYGSGTSVGNTPSYGGSNRPSGSGGSYGPGSSGNGYGSSAGNAGYGGSNRPSTSSSSYGSGGSGNGYSSGYGSSAGNAGYGGSNRPSTSSSSYGSGGSGNGYSSGSSSGSSGDYSGSKRPASSSGSSGYGSGGNGYGSGSRPSGGNNGYGSNDNGYGGNSRPGGSTSSSYGSSGSYGNSQSNSYNSNGSYGSSNSNSYESSSSYGSSNSNYYDNDDSYGSSNRPYGEQSSGSGYGGSKRPYEINSRPNDQLGYGSNQRPYGSGTSSSGGRPPGWSSSYGSGNHYNGNESSNGGGYYSSGNKPYGENGVTYGGRPYYGNSYGSDESNHYSSSSSSYSSGSSNYNSYGSSSYRPSGNDNYNSNRPSSSGYHGDIYDGYSQDGPYGDRFEWNRPQNSYNRPYPTTYGDRYPYKKPGSYQDFRYDQDRDKYNRPQYEKKNPDYEYSAGKPIYGGSDRTDTYGSGYGNYVQQDYNERPQRPDYNDYDRPDSVATVYGQTIAVSHGSPGYKPNNRPGYGNDDKLDRKPGYESNYGGQDTRPAYNRPNERPDNRPGYQSDERPSYGNGDKSDGDSGYRPGYNRPDDRPDDRYGYQSNERPGYGSYDKYDRKPSYGGQNMKPVYNRPDDRPEDRPGYQSNGRPGYDDKFDINQGYGSNGGEDERPNYRPNDQDKIPGYGSDDRKDNRPDYRPNDIQNKRPGYGSSDSLDTGAGNRPSGYGTHVPTRPVEGYRGNGYDNLMPNSPIYDKNQNSKGGYYGSSVSYHSENYGGHKYEENRTNYHVERDGYYGDRKQPSYNEIDKYDDRDKPSTYDSKIRPGYDFNRPGNDYNVNKLANNNDKKYNGQGNGNQSPKPGGGYQVYEEPSGYGSKPNNNLRPDIYDKDKPDPIGAGYGSAPSSNNNSGGYKVDTISGGGYSNKPINNDRPDPGYSRPKGENDRPDPGYGKPNVGDRPSGYGDKPKGYADKPGGYNERPNGYDDRPDGYNERPNRYDERPNGYNDRPDEYNNNRPGGYNNKPDYGNRPNDYGGRPNNDYGNKRPTSYNERPDDYLENSSGYGDRPKGYDERPGGYTRPQNNDKNKYDGDRNSGGGEYNSAKGDYGGERGEQQGYGQNSGPKGPDRPNNRPDYGMKGNLNACYRRVLAGKRVQDRMILGIVPCERLEDCQRSCAEERRFDCETFNYRLDPSNRGKGVCEMTATPVSHLDVRKDFVEDRDYDFYELDRNSAPDCSLWPSFQKYPGHHRPPWRPPGGGFHQEGYYGSESSSGHQSNHRRWECSGCGGQPIYPRPLPGIGGPGNDGRYPGYNDRPSNDVGHYYTSSGDERYNSNHQWNQKGWQSHQGGSGYENDRGGYGGDKRWNRHFVPYDIASGGGGNDRKAWGQYGGSYGYGADHHYDFEKHNKEYGSSYNYWGLNDAYDNKPHYPPNASHYPSRGVTHYDHGYDDHRKHEHDFNYNSLGHTSQHHQHHDKWEGSAHHSYGGGFGYGSYGHQLHGLTPNEGYGPNTDRDRPDYGDDQDYHGYNKHVECSSRSGSGFRFSHGIIRKALQVRDVNECERICFSDAHIDCKSYSFRYTRGPSDNCFLTDRLYRSLDLYNDVQPDRDSDVYAMNPDRQHCRGLESHGPGGRPGYDENLESDCFWRVRSGRRLTPEVTKAALEVRSLAECEEECLRLTTFTCRAFSYRHGPAVIGAPLENCLLADSPASALAPSALVPAPPCALYERGSYGRGCEGDPFRLDSPRHRPPHRGNSSKPDEMCYLQYDTSAKLLPSSVRAGARLGTEHACKLLCADKLRTGRGGGGDPSAHFRCMSFSYTSDPDLPPSKDNCLLSDIQLRDLQPGLDYTPARTHWLFAYDTFDPDCGPVGAPGFGAGLPPGYGPESYPERPPGGYLPGPGSRPLPPGGHLVPSGPPGHYRPQIPLIHLRPDEPPGYPGPADPPGYSRPLDPPGYGPPGHLRPDRPSGPGYPGHPGPSGPPGIAGPGYDGNRRFETGDLGQDTWSFFTVSGWPCRKGSRCAPNKVAGYWSCELEGGEVGSWDYCCHPGHHCGHSRGLDYPWCYVGLSRDQWRPCSEEYYPYAHSRPSPPHQGGGGGPPAADRRPWDKPHGGGYGPGYNDRNDAPGRPHLGGRPYLPEPNRGFWSPHREYERPGYVRVPTIEKNHIRFHHNSGPTGFDRPHWVPVRIPEDQDGPGFQDPPKPGGFGTARYWPVSYLHKNGPPNSTYYNHDQESGRNNNKVGSRDNFDRKPDNARGADRRKDDRVDTKPIEDNRTEKPVTPPPSTDPSVEVPRNARDKENEKNNTGKNGMSDDGMVLISSSNSAKGTPDPMDKRGRIKASIKDDSVENKSKLDDKLENFSGETVEVFTVDEPVKITDKDAKANLERLLKEEKQIEEIGKSFRRRDDSRTSVVVEKRSQHDYGIRSQYKDNFDPVFVPVSLHNTNKKSEKIDEYDDKVKLGLPDDSYSDTSYRNHSARSDRRFLSDDTYSRNYNSRNNYNNSFDRRSVPDTYTERTYTTVDRFDSNQNGRRSFTAPDQFDFDIKRHISTAAIDTNDDRRAGSRNAKFLKSQEIINTQSATTEKSMQSVVNNGQVFYEVSPEVVDDKIPFGRIEKVELKDRAVNVRVPERNEDSTNGDFEPISKPSNNHNERYFDLTAGESGHHKNRRDDFGKTYHNNDVFKDYNPTSRSGIRTYPKSFSTSSNSRVDFVETTTQSNYNKILTSTTQFGARTGKVKKVELPFPIRNSSRIVKRGRRNFRLSYNPNVVRKRLLEKQRLRESEELGLH